MIGRWTFIQICMVVALVGGASASLAAECSSATSDACDDERLRKQASVPNHQKDGVARWSKQESYVIEAKRRGLSCGVARSALHSAFNKLSKDKRKAIQSKLAEDALQAA